MKKKLLALILCAFMLTLSFSLFGCGTSLNKEVSFEGLTLKVPSNWVEEDSSLDTSSYSDINIGTVNFLETSNASTGNWMSVSWSNYNDGKTPDELIKEEEQSAKEINGKNWHQNKLDEYDLESAHVVLYESSYEMDSRDGTNTFNTQYAFIDSIGMSYEIKVYGDAIDIKDIMDTASITLA